MVRLIGYLRDRSRVLLWIFIGFLLFSVCFDFWAERHEAHFFGDRIIGFWSLFGLGGCLLMIVVCKGIAHAWLTRKEGYYDE
ncbi:MAG: hypothetical protein CSA22_07620 [Deltaproteobacteria bacterium]|nr:MAG: hypothetical protein CSA22_07620 [Deltaproteobacteria bacterium]